MKNLTSNKQTILLFALSMSYFIQIHAQSIVPNIKPSNYKEISQGNETIIQMGEKEYKILDGNLLVDIDLSKEIVMDILSKKESPNSVSWWSYQVNSGSAYRKPSFSEPYHKPKWGVGIYRFKGPITYIPGVGLAGSQTKYINFKKINCISWIITEAGELVIPKNNEFVKAEGKRDGYSFYAQRTFYAFGTEENYRSIPEKTKNYFNGGWDLTAKNEIYTGAYLFNNNTIEKKWDALVDLKDGLTHSKYYEIDANGYIQLGETINGAVLITTLNPNLTIKNTLGPALLVHTTEEVWSYNESSALKGKIAPNRLNRMMLLENHELSGLFSQLKSDGNIYIPTNSLGMQPLSQEVTYTTDKFKYKGESSETFFIVHSFIVPYFIDGKMLWNYVFTDPKNNNKFNFEKIEKNPTPIYEEVKPYFSNTIYLEPFNNINPIMVFTRKTGSKKWNCVSHGTDIIGGTENLAEDIPKFEQSTIRIVSKAAHEKFVVDKQRKAEFDKKNHEEWLKSDVYKEIQARKQAAIAEAEWRKKNIKNTWGGNSQQTTERYRQNVINSARTWQGTTTITTTYKNGRMTGVYTH